MTKRIFLSALIAAGLTFTPLTPAAVADDMKKDTMSKDTMAKDKMPKDEMNK
ncbi:MAG: pentapeptide MXKDX repeat protein [Pseudolabrys sp.]